MAKTFLCLLLISVLFSQSHANDACNLLDRKVKTSDNIIQSIESALLSHRLNLEDFFKTTFIDSNYDQKLFQAAVHGSLLNELYLQCNRSGGFGI
jgi:hypothetical protein